MIDAFPTNQQAQVRVQLSVSLICVLSQVLLKRIDKVGRVASYEFLVVTPAIANLIRENKTFRIDSAIQTGRKFGMQPTPDHDRKCIIVVDVHRDEDVLQMSVLVDAVSEVLHIATGEIEDTPSINGDVHLNFIQGIAKTKGTIKILLDVDTVLGAVELNTDQLKQVFETAPADLN